MDDALGEQYLEDLQDTKDKEQSILDERIKNLDLYIQALQYRNEEADRILRDRLIMEMMNLNNMEDVQDAILEDWNKFNEYSEGSFKHYDGIFNNFLDSYRDNVLELDSLQKQMKEVLSSTMSGILGQNNQNIQMGINNTSNIANAMGMSEVDKQALTAAGKKYTIAQKAYLETGLSQYKQAMESAHDQAEAIRAKYGYSGGPDGSALIITDEGLYAQYMGGSGYQEQMKNEEDFYDFYSNLFGDFNDAESDRISDLKGFGNSLSSSYGSINTSGKNYIYGEESNLNGHRSNYYYQSDINDDIISNWLMYMDDANISYDYIIMDFESFIDKYRDMIEEYANLAGSIGDIEIGAGGGSIGGDFAGDNYWMDKMTEADRKALQAAGQKYNEAQAMYQQTGLQYYKNMMAEAHAEAEAIRNKYGYSGGGDGSEWIPTNSYTNSYGYVAMSGSTMLGDNRYKSSMSVSDQAALNKARSDYTNYQQLYYQTGDSRYQALMDQAHKNAEAIRAKYGYSGGADGSLLIETTKNNYNQLGTIESERVGAYGSYISSIMGLQNKESSINLSSLSDFQSYISGTGTAYNTKNALDTTANMNEAYNVNIHGNNAYEQAGINADIVNDWLTYNSNTQVQYDLVNMQFSDFLTKYAQQIQEYANLQAQLSGVMGGGMMSGGIIGGGGGLPDYGGSGFGSVSGSYDSSGGNGIMVGDTIHKGEMSEYDQSRLQNAGLKYTAAQEKYLETGEQIYKDMMDAAHKEAESIRNQYGYSGGADGSGYIQTGSSKTTTSSKSSTSGGRVSQDIGGRSSRSISTASTLSTMSLGMNSINSSLNDITDLLNNGNNSINLTTNSVNMGNIDTITAKKVTSTGTTSTYTTNNYTTSSGVSDFISTPSSSSGGSGSKSGSSFSNNKYFEDIFNLPGGSYVQSDGTVYYPEGHPGAEIDLNRDGLPDSDWLYSNGAPSWVTIANIMDETGMDYDVAREIYNAKYNQGLDITYDSISNNKHLAHNQKEYLIQSAENAGWSGDQLHELVNYLGGNDAEYNAELEAAIEQFKQNMPKDMVPTLNGSINQTTNAIYDTAGLISSGTQTIADKLAEQGIIIAGTSHMYEYNTGADDRREQMEQDKLAMSEEEFINKYKDQLVLINGELQMPLYGDYDITNGGIGPNGEPGYLGNSNATVGAGGGPAGGAAWLGDQLFSQYLYSQNAPYEVWYAEKLKEEKKGMYWSVDDYYQKEVMSNDDADLLKEAGEAYTEAQKKYEETGNVIYKDIMDQAHKQAESIRNQYGYSGGADGSEFIEGIQSVVDAEGEVNNDRITGLEAFGGDLETLWNYINDASSNGLAEELANNNKHEDNADDLSSINKQLIDTWVKYNQDSKVQMDYANKTYEQFVDKYGSQINDFANLNNKIVNNFNSTSDSLSGIMDQIQANQNAYDKWYDKNFGSGGKYEGSGGSSSSDDDDSVVYPVGGGAAGGVTNNDGSWSPFPGGPVYDSAPSGSSSSDDDDDYIFTSPGKTHNGTSVGAGTVVDKNTGNLSSSWSSKGTGSSNTMARDPSKAGQTISKNGYSVTYNEKGYVTSTKKESPKRTGISKYAGGIEEGAVTYTGLAMLHGTPSKPEYVLNNDQAYNLLYNLTTSRKPEIDNSDNSEANAQIWNLYGDINIDGTDDPAEFWNTIMNSAGNRFNVTKSGGNRK